MDKTKSNLVALHRGKTTSEHDMIWKGKTLHLAIHPAGDRTWNMMYWFWCCRKPVEAFPGMMFGGGDYRQPFTGIIVNHRWWHKLLGTTEEQVLNKGLTKLKALTEELKKDIKRHDQIQEKFGIRKDDDEDSGGYCEVQKVPTSPDSDPDSAG